MNETTTAPTISFALTYQNLRALFIAGFTLDAVLFFVPVIKTKVGSFAGIGGEERTLSALDLTHALMQSEHAGRGIFYVVIFSAMVAFAVLAIKIRARI